jgi:hypothetical protein
MRNWILAAPKIDDFIRLLRAWRFWVLGALLGALLGAGCYYVFPPQYRARATVVIDFNMEQAWPNNPDDKLFYYLDREARKLVDVANSDAVLQQVAVKTGRTVTELRAGELELSQPQDGGWHFYASATRADAAANLASAWAEAFTSQVQQGIQTAVTLDAARKALAANPGDAKTQAEVDTLEAKSLGITPELQISAAQIRDLPVERKIGLGSYVLAGAGLCLTLGALLILFTRKKERA